MNLHRRQRAEFASEFGAGRLPVDEGAIDPMRLQGRPLDKPVVCALQGICYTVGLELMLVASTLALVAFSRFNGTMDGNVFVFFILTVAAAEVAVGLAIIVALFRKRHTVQVDELNTLKN